MRILVVDNFDSFTYNLVDYLRHGARAFGLSADTTVVTNDVELDSAELAAFDAAVISPGPGTPHNPDDIGLSAAVLDSFRGPILGVCLGMQAMVTWLGGAVGLAPEPVHGRTTPIRHTGGALFAGIDSPHEVVRYHSLCAVEVPAELAVTAVTDDAAAIPMAVEHRARPWYGVQFHPESIGDSARTRLVENFLAIARDHQRALANGAFSVRTLGRAVDPAAVAQQLRPGNSFWLDAGGFIILGEGARHLTYDVESNSADFFDAWNDAVRARRVDASAEPIPGCPFALGWVGYLGYELGKLCGAGEMPRYPGPDAQLMFCERAIVIHPDRDETYLLSFAGDDEWEIAEPVRRQPPRPAAAARPTPIPVHLETDYLALIRRAQELIRRGESYEVCLTNRLELPQLADPLAAFATLRENNPTGRTGYLDFGNLQLLSTTPELFLAADAAGTVTSKPIKGTRPRGTADTDADIAAELAGCEKDRSENLMIVDLVRNDLARVCDDIAVPQLCEVETYPTVHQLVSTVTGKLRAGHTPIDALRAAFPGGSMTGAPKRRTMQIISELEGTWRGPYSGAFGYLSLNGAADFSMVIRTLVNTEAGASYGVGGAILHLSDPAEEWEETRVKARVLEGLEP